MDTQFLSLETILREFYAPLLEAVPNLSVVVDAICDATANENNQ
jgi:hypothetical protein